MYTISQRESLNNTVQLIEIVRNHLDIKTKTKGQFKRNIENVYIVKDRPFLHLIS